jgi:transposase
LSKLGFLFFHFINYEDTLDQKVSIREALPATHLARFVVDVVAQLNLSKIYARFSVLGGGTAIAPEILLALLFYGYATGVFSSRKIEKATYENLAFRFVANNLHPDHDTISNFRKTFLVEIQNLFVEILMLAQVSGILKLENLSGDGSKIHADASKSKAVSYKRLGKLEDELRQEVEKLFALAEKAEKGEVQLPAGLFPEDEIALRQERLAKLAEAKAVLEARAQERYKAEQAEYEAKLREREE